MELFSRTVERSERNEERRVSSQTYKGAAREGYTGERGVGKLWIMKGSHAAFSSILTAPRKLLYAAPNPQNRQGEGTKGYPRTSILINPLFSAPRVTTSQGVPLLYHYPHP